MISFKDLISFFYFPILVFILNLFLVFLGIYSVAPWIDIPMHLLGGFTIAYSGSLILDYLGKRNLVKINNYWIWVLIVISFVALIAVFWEVVEFIYEFFYHVGLQPSIKDTILDLVLGIFGGFLFSIFRKF